MKLQWAFIGFLVCFVACGESRRISTSADAEVEGGDSQAGGSDSGGPGSQVGKSGASTSGDGGNGGASSYAGRGGTDSYSETGGASQNSGGSAVSERGDLDDYEPRNAMSVSSVPRPVCPETPPTEGEECPEPDLWCGYGTEIRADCRVVYVCDANSTWYLNDGIYYQCAQPPENACPEVPTPGEPCEFTEEGTPSDGIICEYEGFVICTCNRDQSRFDPNMSWYCFDPPSDTRCPPVLPNFGEGCETHALACTYGDPCIASGQAVFCRRGAWEFGYATCVD